MFFKRRIFAILWIVLIPLGALAGGLEGLPDDVMNTTSESANANKAPTSPRVKSGANVVEKIVQTKADKKAERPTTPSVAVAAPVKEKAKNEKPDQSVDIKALKEIDKRYQTAKSVAMDVEKTLVMGLLGKEKNSKGRLLLAQGKMRMEIESPEKSLVVVDGKTLWVADYPPAEFKNAAIQVLKGNLDSRKGAQQGFVGLLTRGGVLKHFKVTGTQQDEKGRGVYFLAPTQETFEFKRARLTLSENGKSIYELCYWDERDNETRMRFSNVKFNAPVSAKSFEFVPPTNSDVTTF